MGMIFSLDGCEAYDRDNSTLDENDGQGQRHSEANRVQSS